MNRQPFVGLIAAGPVSSALYRLHDIHMHLGPVCSASLRVASRIANRLKAGRGARLEALDSVPFILISGPEAALDDLIALAVEAGIDWTGRTVLLFDSRRGSDTLHELKRRGALVGTVDPVDVFPEPRFIADVEIAARRMIHRFAQATHSSFYLLEPGKKHVFLAGTTLSRTFLTPLLVAATDCLRKAGLSLADAAVLSERMVYQSLRTWVKSGRKGWNAGITRDELDAMQQQVRALQEESLVLSEHYQGTARLAMLLFGEENGQALDVGIGDVPDEGSR